ncbi:hypothetical protein [Bradyrhizobium sp. URHD0069]|uniref:hypothetical protein n=1 Tax=Bradyrhizobium sp. URHD0069 TaxID=1380355 RepID=UPI000496F66F|nr:hypothetical protein [Bradyrhizobium sp. URHD0069]
MIVIAGFDLATCTGAAILQGPKVLHAEAFRAKGKSDPEIFSNWRIWFRAMLVSHCVQHVAIEQPLRTPQIDRKGELSPKSSMATYLRAYGFRAHAIQICDSLNIPCEEVNMSTWRAAFTGNGHADKAASMVIAKQLYPGLKSLDAAESIGVGWWLNGHLSQLKMFAGVA